MYNSKEQRENTLAFFREYDLLMKIREIPVPAEDEGDDGEAGKNASAPEWAVDPFDTLVRPGELRLLSHCEKLTYCVTLPGDSPARLAAVPLSHCENPATDGEMRAGNIAGGALFTQVYQAWNTRMINRAVLARSWRMGRIGADEEHRVAAFLDHYRRHTPLAPEIAALTGVPVTRPDDPRNRFMAGEAENLLPLDLANDEFEALSSCFGARRPAAFTVPAPLFQAAAGRNSLSPLYACDGKEVKFITGLELEAFRPVPPRQEMPGFTWFVETLPEACRKWQSVCFVHRRSGCLLGSGVVKPVRGGYEFELLYDLSVFDHEEVTAPADIQLFVRPE